MNIKRTSERCGVYRPDILAVDDMPNNLHLLSSILTVLGYKVRSVTDGQMAIMAAQAAPPDLVLLDINMPGVDGYEVCQALKSHPLTKDIPVIFISALNEVEDKVRGFAIGGVDYISKPFQTEEVLARVENHLALRRLQQQLEWQNQQLLNEVQQRTQAEAELRALFAAMTDTVVVYDRAGCCLKLATVNSHLEHSIDRALHKQFPSEQHKWLQEQVARVLAMQQPQAVEYRLTLGERDIWYSATVSPLTETTVLWVARNITDNVLTLDALRRSNSLLNAQKEAAIDGILAVDEQGRIVNYNHRFCEMWNLPADVLLQNEHGLLSALLLDFGLPDTLVEMVESSYDYPERPVRAEIPFGDRVFDCYSGPVLSPEGRFYGLNWYFRDVTDRVRAQEALKVEKEKSEELLLNILPAPIATRLKEHPGLMIADGFESATVLFADIVGFTDLCGRISPVQVVGLLNRIFLMFDALAEKYGLEKIKTIGDAYMVVGGLPVPRPDHVAAVAEMAIDLRDVMAKFRTYEGWPIAIRIGLDTGPVVAGVIGKKKFSYDLWGDAVNVASRMEASGVAGKIQVTAEVYNQLRDRYTFELRGTIDVKGKGPMLTYWLQNRR